MLLKDVLIKLMQGGRSDKVLYIDNVPEEFFYEMKHPLTCVGEGQAQHWTLDTSKPKQQTLHQELKASPTGDGAIVFDLDNEPSSQRYLALMRYIKMTYPANQMIPEAVWYSQDYKDPKAPPIALSQVPRVVLPVLSPTETKESANSDSTTPALDIEAIKKAAVEEHELEKKRERMAKARAGRIKVAE